MDIQTLSKSKDTLRLMLSNTNYVFVNTLRRIMMTDVPTLAVKSVSFSKNTTALFDEIIGHRLAMIPLITDLESYTLQEKCTCKGDGCVKCQTIMSVNCEGPITLYSQDLKIQDPNVKPVEGKIPIVKILKGQELEFEAKITLGKGLDHAKYITGLVYYRGYPEFIPHKKTLVKEALKACNGLLEEKSDKLHVTDFNKWNEQYEQICREHEIEIKNSDKDFIFTIESKGKISCEEMLKKSLDVLDEKLNLFAEKLKTAK